MKKHENILEAPITDPDQLMHLLPHRAPMIMVDAMFQFNEQSATSGLTITDDNIFVDSHCFSETGLIEHMAQTAALFIGYGHHLQKKAIKEGAIGAIKSLKILDLPSTASSIKSTVDVVYNFEQMTMVSVTTRMNGQIIATADMSLVLIS